MKPAEVLVLSPDDREAWIRGHVTDAEASAAVLAYSDGDWDARPGSLSHVRGHYGLGTNDAGESVTRRLYLDPTRTGPGWFAVTVATVRRVRADE